MQRDPAREIKDALAEEFTDFTSTLHVDEDYQPGDPVLLVADDGGGQFVSGAWLAGRGPLRIVVRLTAFARGRTQARDVLCRAVDFILADKPAGISRIESVPAVLDARDPKTGAHLASIAMPVTVKPL